MKWIIERLAHEHIKRRILQDILLSAIMLLAAYLMLAPASSAAGRQLAVCAVWLLGGFIILDMLGEAASVNRQLLFAVKLLVVTGIAVQTAIRAASGETAISSDLLGFYLLGLLAGIPLGAIAVHWMVKLPPMFIAAACLLFTIAATAVLLAFGTEISGTKAWLRLGGFSFQMTELIKISSCTGIAVSLYMPGSPGFVFVLAAAFLALHGISAVLLSELATFFVLLGATLLALLFINRDPRPVLAGIAAAVVLLLLFCALCEYASGPAAPAFLDKLGAIYSAKIRPRFTVLFDGGASNPDGWGYQIIQARRAILLSKPVGLSRTALAVHVPVQTSDFVVTGLTAAAGVLPAIFLIGTPLLLILKAVVSPSGSHFSLPAILSVLAGAVLIFQAVLATLSGSGLFLTLGIGLPLVSDGGTSVAACCLLLGMIAYSASGFQTLQEGGLPDEA